MTSTSPPLARPRAVRRAVRGYNPGWTGLAVHEWLCVVAIVPLLFHIVVNWDQTRRSCAGSR